MRIVILRDDDVLKVCAGRFPGSPALASQPTASRLENGRSATELYHMALAFVDNFIASYAEEPKVIIIDCDDSNANTYANQQLTLFNQYNTNPPSFRQRAAWNSWGEQLVSSIKIY